jgi:hypothetical protein
LVGRVDEGARQRQGFLLAERSEIDTHQGAASGRGAPRLIERIALDPRCQYQEGSAVGDRCRHPGKISEHERIRPVDVLDDDENWPPLARGLDEFPDHSALAIVTLCIAHRLEYRALFNGLRQVE